MWVKDWRRNLAALWLGQTMTMAAFSFTFPFVPLFLQTLDVRGTAEAAQWAGLIASLPALAMTVTQPLWGKLADRSGRKPMVIRSMGCAALTNVAMGFVATAGQLAALRFLQGAITGTIAASTALVATSMPRHRLGFSLGVMHTAVFLGTSLGPLGGGLVADAFGYRASFFAAAALMAAGTATVAAFVREDFTPAPPDPRRKSLWAESRSLFALALMPILMGTVFLIQFCNTTVNPLLSLFVADLSGGENAATAAGTVLAATGAASTASALALGRVSDRIGHGVILSVCLLGAALTYFPQALVQQVWQLLLLRIALGLFIGGLMPSANALIAEQVPREQRGVAFGLASSSTALSHTVGPLFGAGIATVLGMRAIFLATGGVFALAWVWATLGLRRNPPGRAPGQPPGQRG